MTTLVVAMAACIASEGFFSGSEMAMVSADKVRLDTRASEGHVPSQQALALLEREDLLFGTCLIGTNLSTISGATLAAVLVARAGLEPTWVLAYVPFAVLFGEALPKTVMRHHADRLVPVVALILRLFQWLFRPALAIVTGWNHMLRRITGSKGGGVTRADIVELLENDTPAIDPVEHRMIRKVFELPQVTVEDVMSPLVEIYALLADATVGEAADLIIRTGHSRIPVFRDRIDNIVGLIQHHDLLTDAPDDTPIEGLMRPVRFVPETKRADDLLHEMRRGGEHFAVAVDEYGGAVGVVTIEDLLEEVIGEIHDERDDEGPGIRRLGERSWRVHGRVEIDAVAQAIGRELPEGHFDTVAGLLVTRLGRIPRVGETVVMGSLSFRIEEASDRAILGVHLTLTG